MMSCFLENIGMAGLFPKKGGRERNVLKGIEKELSIQNSKSRRIFFNMEGK